jgi:hypothetical protein
MQNESKAESTGSILIFEYNSLPHSSSFAPNQMIAQPMQFRNAKTDWNVPPYLDPLRGAVCVSFLPA